MILTRKCLLVDIFLTRSLSKSLAFCEFASVNFEPCIVHHNHGCTHIHTSWNDVTHSDCYCLIIHVPVTFALTTDNESDEVLLHPSPRLWRNPSTTLETVSATDSVVVLDASAATTGADWSPKDELLIIGKILSHLKTWQQFYAIIIH